MRLTDTLFYWLQTKRMTELRPEDEAARDSLRFFAQILSEDHDLAEFAVASKDSAKIYVVYTVRGEAPKTVWFDREAAEQLAVDLYGNGEGAEDDQPEVNE
ncbi:hypothetical protein [Cohnella thailandensis]|uniref:Uncharacterized protein n=1 Tax=Cohnella thailandensis TaxID=557557 RepID=A0A841T553_9BACL|nr:hypothetical protein [Cohnella thailandensis]MBB6636261.1 hypothetical protein [Cohnella thailandensis]MBP1973770.1 hypothetical protein [Cohnella thailandensis]